MSWLLLPSAVDLDGVTLVLLDPLCGLVQQLVRHVRQRTGRRELLADHGYVRVSGRALRLAEAVEPPARQLEDRIRARAIVLLRERDVHPPHLIGHEAPPGIEITASWIFARDGPGGKCA